MALSALMALGVLMFVMLSGQLYRAFDLVTRGVSPWLIGKYLFFLLPDILRFALPLSVLIATVLVFSRMSADSEIVAMKAMGASIWQLVSPGLLLAFAASVLCMFLSLQWAPNLRFHSNQLWWDTTGETPLAMLEPGKFLSVTPQLHLCCNSREGSELKGIHLVLDGSSGEVQDITAKSGRLEVDGDTGMMRLSLDEAVCNEFSLAQGQRQRGGTLLYAKSVTVPIPYGGRREGRKVTRKSKYMDVGMLCANIVLDREAGKDVTKHLVELHERLSLSMSPFSFLLLGLPFGIRSRRSELSIGLLICVLLAVVFYGFLLLANALSNVGNVHPQYIIWIPNLLYQAVGVVMLRRLERFN